MKDKFNKVFKIKVDDISSDKNFLLYKDRLDHELGIILEMKYASYFLIVSDYIKWAKKNSIPVGPGRGSGAGSLVAWALLITDLDPIKYGLLFERFLNPERLSMPDFDVDFCMERRDEVINYVQDKYGADRVAQIFARTAVLSTVKPVDNLCVVGAGLNTRPPKKESRRSCSS